MGRGPRLGRKNKILPLVLMLAILFMRSDAQTSEIENLFRTLETTKNAHATTGAVDQAEPVLERLAHASDQTVAAALPVILRETSNPSVAVRRVAAMALYVITTRPDGQKVLAAQTATFTALLTDPDIPIRRVTAMAIDDLRPHAASPLVPVLNAYLAREDAVSTIGAGLAGMLMRAAPNDAATTNAVVRFMRRRDQTSATRASMLISISVVRSDNPEVAREVAAYATDPDEQVSVDAIQTLQAMGKSAILNNEQPLSRIAADTSRSPSVRTAATKALSTVR
jgi:hypothetical protein